MRFAGLAAALALAGCGHRPPPPVATAPHYLVGPGYQLAGVWHYPSESFGYDATGLAERVADHAGLTADGEAFDPTAMAGAHQTLQLPAIARVTNLENGRQVLIRINDRGPANPGRVLGLSRRAADLLGAPAAAPIEVRIQVENAVSQALRDQLQGGPAGITAAPRGAVMQENLPPPVGIKASRRGRVATSLSRSAAAMVPESRIPDRLPETVTQVTPQPGQLWIRAGQFSQSRYADTLEAKLKSLPVRVIHEYRSRSPSFVVMAGPFSSPEAADTALDRARAAGVTDAVIVVE